MIPVTIGIGHSRTELGLIYESFQSALDALGYRAIVGSGSTIYINDVEPVNTGKLQFTAEDESALIQAVKFGPEEKIPLSDIPDHKPHVGCQSPCETVSDLYFERCELSRAVDPAV